MVSDGAWGTSLQGLGLEPGECPEIWSLDHPEKVRGIGQSFVDAGADMLGTNSFGGNRVKLENFDLGDRVDELNRAAARLSRETAGNERHVLGSIGPTGKMTLMGEISEEEFYDIFTEQALALEKGGADVCCIETMWAMDEALSAVRAVKENTNCEVICSFTFEKTRKRGYKTMMGVTPAEMARKLRDAGVDIIGSNCGNGMAGMLEIAREIRRAEADLPLIIQANAGMPEQRDGETVYPEKPSETAGFVGDLIDLGVNIIGGCCGTGPEHILAIRSAVDLASKS